MVSGYNISIKMQFVHLHVHSHYSLLDGLAKIGDLVNATTKLGMKAIALTDHGNLYGAIEFYQKAKKAGIKPILGMEAYIAQGSMHEKQSGIDNKRYHLTLLAENSEGWKNLLKLATMAHLEGFYYKPRLDKMALAKHAKGLIALSGCLSGEIPRALLGGNREKAEMLTQEYKNIFGNNNFYIELSHHNNIHHHQEVQKLLRELAKKTGTPVIATQDVHYVSYEDAKAQDVLLAIQTNTRLDDEDRLTMKDDNFSLRSQEEMTALFSDIPEAIINTVKIADRVNIEIPLGVVQLPSFPVPDGDSAESYLKKLSSHGLQKRYGKHITVETKMRLDYELSIIQKTGFAHYFLIVQDLVNWAKANGIVVGPGRGSAAGSIVSYLLNITEVDPLKYNLLFERFMNPERVTYPDIDLDFADTRRGEVIEYITKKYGENHVAQIITFGTMAARAAVRDSGRALGLSYQFCDEIAKMIPFGASLEKALETVPELKTSYEKNPDTKWLIDAARRLEGVARHASTHACGIVITKDPLMDIVPLQHATSGGEEKKQSVVTQFEMHAIEDLGLLKMDILGLTNLSIIEETLKRIKERTGKNIDIAQTPLSDQKPYQMLAAGNTVGVFQLEGAGMTKYLKELQPTSIEDIIVMISLYRPGTLDAGMIPRFLARKNGREEVTYLHPKLEHILKSTYGIMIYQEQLMQMAQIIAGFTLGEADILRKAIGKKIRKLLQEQKEKFMKGADKNKVSKKTAEELWKLVEPFDRYGFNRSHATAYALVAFQTAWLKTYYPIEFMASLLNAEAKNVERIAFLVTECKKEKITVLPPDINESDVGFTVRDNKNIRFGLGAIKNVGHNIVSVITGERLRGGKFTSLTDLLERIYSKDLNKKSLEALTKSGAMDSLGERNQILNNMDTLLLYLRENQAQKKKNQESLFGLSGIEGMPGLKLALTKATTNEERLKWEKELLGLYISGHPLDRWRDKLPTNATTITALKKLEPGRLAKTAGILSNIKKIFTKKGDQMAFARLEDLTDSIEAVIFPRALKEFEQLLVDDKCVAMKGKLNERNGNLSILCDHIEELL